MARAIGRLLKNQWKSHFLILYAQCGIGRIYIAQPSTSNQRDCLGVQCPFAALIGHTTGILLGWGRWLHSHSRTSWRPSPSRICLRKSPYSHWIPNISGDVHDLSTNPFNTRFLRSGLLKKELVLIFLFSKYNSAPSSTKTELYQGMRCSFLDSYKGSRSMSLILCTPP